jgi:hypothetical protein
VAGREVKRVTGVNGRENALKKAAESSDTDSFYCFPGKLLVDDDFDFNWHPPLDHDPKHYIFYAKNPLNRLEYGHMAAVCYNKKLVLDTSNYGLDFTMSRLHDVIPTISGIAQYNADPVMTWRTAFREVIKLTANPTTENLERLDIWLTVAEGKNSQWSIQGARDGVEYYKKAKGDYDELMKTFAWSWLNQQFNQRYSKLTKILDKFSVID